MSATLEQVQQAPVGTQVKVLGVPWEKVEGGLRRDGTVLALTHFSGYLTAGQVEVEVSGWQPLGWYMSTRCWRFVTRVEGDTAYGVEFASSDDEATPGTWTEPPGTEWRWLDATHSRLWMRRVSALYALWSTQMPAEPWVRLRNYADANDDDDLVNLLDEIDGTERTHVSTVRITGNTFWTPTRAQCKAWLGDDFIIDDVSDAVTIYWVRTVTVEKTGAGCRCDYVDSDDIAAYLPADYEDYDFTAECG